MFKIYHDCGFVSVDETRKLIEFKRVESCICAGDCPFWKRLQDCKYTGIKIRSIVKTDRIKKQINGLVIDIFANWFRKWQLNK